MSLTILYQDKHLIAVNKPAGQLVHPADHPRPDDEVTMKILRDQIGQEVSPLHRIDRPTSGAVLFGLDKETNTLMFQQFQQKKVQKIYHALVRGVPQHNHWVCRKPLQKKPNASLQQAETEFKTLKTIRNPKLRSYADNLGDHLTLIEASPITGRYHQIRKHLAHINFPIIGDYLYADIDLCDQIGNLLKTGTRMLLQSNSLTFTHPHTKEPLTINSPKEPLLEKLGLYPMG